MINYALKGSSLCVSGSASQKRSKYFMCWGTHQDSTNQNQRWRIWNWYLYNFPSQTSRIDASAIVNGKALCGCPWRIMVPDKPANIPFPPIASNRDRLELWLREHFKSSAFNTCPHQPLQMMTRKPLDITFTQGAKPSAVHKPIPVPHHWNKRVKQDLDRDIALGIIEPVPTGTPTGSRTEKGWISQEGSGPAKIRYCYKEREIHHTPSPFNQVSVVSARTKKTVLDAWNGDHSLPLSPATRDATTIITEWSRHRYLRAPQGFHASGDGYTRRFDDITVDAPRKTRGIDDSLLWDETRESVFWHTLEYITHCGWNGIVLNPGKFQFTEDELEFAGFRITADGIKPTKKMTETILNFPTPTNITDVRSWFTLINQVSYAFSQAEAMSSFRELLRTKDRKFYWDATLDKLFKESKRNIVREIEEGVKTFEMNRATCLPTDCNKTSIGYFLFQKHCRCSTESGPNCGENHWKIILAGSRFTKDAESRYSPMEGEALALIYGLESCRMFILGCPDLLVTVDYQPLVKIFSDQVLKDIKNPCLFTFKERSLMYRFHIKHVPGKLNTAPDCTSRYPASPKRSGLTSIDITQQIDRAMQASIISAYEHDPKLRAITCDRIVAAAATDEECRALAEYI